MTEMKNNIRQRSNGTWEGRYYDVDGKQHSLYGRTKAIVKDKLAEKHHRNRPYCGAVGLGVDEDLQGR